MENIPKIDLPERRPAHIPVPDYLRDHVFNGQAVLPAVEGMRVLADSAGPSLSGSAAVCIEHADFRRFLGIDPGVDFVEAFIETCAAASGDIALKLVTVRKSGNTGISRVVEHLSLSFSTRPGSPEGPQIDRVLGLEGICLNLKKELIYGELVPFRPSYQNLEEVLVSERGALGFISGGRPEAFSEALGSPFPLDAAFHAACVWGQRFAGLVGFPIHIDRRVIARKTLPGQPYICRITPVEAGPGQLVFDLWIYNEDMDLFEEVTGLRMKDVSGGTRIPPEWILNRDGGQLAALGRRCKDLSLIELETVTRQCERILSPVELERFRDMREKRGRSFLAARLALKNLSRRISSDDMMTRADSITTMKPDGRPQCPQTNGAGDICCSVSHDSRFAVAAVSDSPVGIDVEEISERVLKSRHIYMHDGELALVKSHPLGELESSTRVWTIKEAVSKAGGMHLTEAWSRTIVKEIGRDSSAVQIDGEMVEALHAVVDNHIITLIAMKG